MGRNDEQGIPPALAGTERATDKRGPTPRARFNTPEAFQPTQHVHATIRDQGTRIGVGVSSASSPVHDDPETVARLVPGAHIQHYELIRELGRGGMGTVWAARDTKLGRRVAMKFLLDASRAIADRFLVEARATALCNHDNIVIIHQVDEYDGLPFMVLEFLEGHSLRSAMTGRLAASRVIELVLPIARALVRAHELGIVHRDLKPENVVVTATGQVKVLDFGIAKAVASGDASTAPADLDAVTDLHQTRKGAIVGTLPYMSPEQLGMGEIDHRTDLWAVGVMMWEMLVGRHPIAPLTANGLIVNAASEDPMPSVKTHAPGVPDRLAALVEACLRKRSTERLPTAAELVRSLEELSPGRVGRRLADGESPYPGLTAFQETDANRFFGRARDVSRMTTKIRELPLTGIVGPSGAGKSSFIRAGVGPALKASGEAWEILTMRPGRQPIAALASVVRRLDTDIASGDRDDLAHRLSTEPGLVGALLRARAAKANTQILVFVDQFEELYTLAPDADERRAFTAALVGIADDTAAPLRVVVSMRSDFLDRISEDPRFMDELSRGLVFLQPLDRAGLREALVAPIEMVGHRFESSAMVEDMLDSLVGTSGALPLLQFAAAKLWDARDRSTRMLTVSSYNAIGGISGALATHADDVIAKMNAPAKRLTQTIFRRLVTPERTRAIVELADLRQLDADAHEVTRMIELLVEARLLIVQTRGDSGGGSVEIVHESLIDRWPTLKRWLDEDQEDAAFLAQLAAAAKQWEARERATGLLWRGDAMDEAQRWFKQRTRVLPPRELAFLEAVFALARRGTRIKRAALVGAFAVLGLIAAGAFVAFLWVRGAEQSARESAATAERERQRTEDALARKNAEEAQRLAAEQREKATEAEKRVVEVEKRKAETAVAETAEQLRIQNGVLKDKIVEASTARERAEQVSSQLRATSQELDAANKRLHAENERLKKQVLATKLKGYNGPASPAPPQKLK